MGYISSIISQLAEPIQQVSTWVSRWWLNSFSIRILSHVRKSSIKVTGYPLIKFVGAKVQCLKATYLQTFLKGFYDTIVIGQATIQCKSDGKGSQIICQISSSRPPLQNTHSNLKLLN